MMSNDEKIGYLLSWVVGYEYEEDTEGSIGRCKARIWIRDGFDELQGIFGNMSEEDKIDLAASLVRLVAHPCEGMEEDFRDQNEPWEYNFKVDKEAETLRFEAVFRV